jgi:hypothetical protein
MQYFLIHGYGKALDIQEPDIPENGGFYIFDNEITQNQAYPYIWAEPVQRNFLTPYNLIAQIQLYYRERYKTEDTKEHQRLYQELESQKPKTIIAHSSGARLLVNYLVDYKLPPSVQTIIFVQADISREELDLANLPNQAKFINFWCWWDPALITSTLLNKYIPIGLCPPEPKYSQFYPLYKLPNPHQNIWKDNKFKQIIEETII